MTAEQILALRDALQPEQTRWASLWRLCNDFCLIDDPNRISGLSRVTSGAYTTPKIETAIGRDCLTVLAGGCKQWICPGAYTDWVSWQPQPGQSRRVSGWLQDCNKRAEPHIEASGLYEEAHSMFGILSCNGAAGFLVMPGEELPFRCQSLMPSEFLFSTGWDGGVDQCIIRYEKSTTELLDKWKDKCPGEVHEAREKDPGKKWEVLFCVYKRPESKRPEYEGDPDAMAYEAVWLLVATKTVLNRGGYDDMPLIVPRWEKWSSGSRYGVSPAMVALCELTGVNLHEEILSVLGKLQVEPRVLRNVVEEGVIDLGVGGVSQVTGMDNVKEWATSGRFDIGLKIAERKEDKIRRIFYVHMFEQISSVEREMTMYETRARQQEAANRIAPAMSRLGTEWIQPLMRRIFLVLLRKGFFDRPPQDAYFQGSDGGWSLAYPKVVQTNRMTRTLAAKKHTAFDNLMARVTPLAQARPELLDIYNFEAMLLDLDEADGVDNGWHNDPDTVAGIRQSRAQAQAQAAMQEAMLKAASSKPGEVAALAKENGLV